MAGFNPLRSEADAFRALLVVAAAAALVIAAALVTTALVGAIVLAVELVAGLVLFVAWARARGEPTGRTGPDPQRSGANRRRG
jgi:hypothetical protein